VPQTHTINVLGELSPKQFLEQYWQKQPLLIRNAIPKFQTPISPDELAGLACEPEVESRIVLQHTKAKARIPWELRHGPFSETSFSKLPQTHWTLLVQECNKHVPELAMLLENFKFIPGWRVDDVMVSYAAPDGSVGPHVDQYDVFLLQGLGQRLWQINTQAEHGAWLPDTELRILQQFESQQQWLLEPGDMLYLPPGVAHYGIAQGECMTLSIGFRAPSHYDLLSAFAEDVFADISDPFAIPRYQDPQLSLQTHSGEITAQSLAVVSDILQSYSRDNNTIGRWFGRYITQSVQPAALQPAEPAYSVQSLQQALQQHPQVVRSELTRYAFISQTPQITYLYLDGNEYPLTGESQTLAALVCDQRVIDGQQLQQLMQHDAARKVLLELFNQGYLEFDANYY